jgi:hypothetical protein
MNNFIYRSLLRPTLQRKIIDHMKVVTSKVASKNILPLMKLKGCFFETGEMKIHI